MRIHRKTLLKGGGACALAVALLLPATAPASGATSAPVPAPGNSAGDVATIQATSEVVRPDDPHAAGPAPTLTTQQASQLVLGVLNAEERGAANLGTVKPPPGAAAAPAGQQTVPAAQSDSLLIRRNNRNTRANVVANTLAEPGAANDGLGVFYTGNTFASFSNDAGATWNAVTLPGGPPDAPNPCCDLDVVRAHSRDRTFSSLLYTNDTITNGVVRIFVRSAPNAAPLCSYTIDPGGATSNVLPDYPHLAVSNNFLYLSTNNSTNGSTWSGAQVRRFNLTQMSACQTAATNIFTQTGTVGQRILTPVEGATTVMFFGSNESSTSFRVFSWPESTTVVSSFLRSVGASTFANPDCRGGVGNFDFIERSTAWSIAGFRLRGATGGGRVTFWWPVAADASHTQAHLNGASFRTSDLALIAQPVVFNNSQCFGYPAVASNSLGDYALSMAVGGRAGGGGSAAQGAVAVDDGSSAGIFFPVFSVTASGTHNRSDARFGDYFTVRTNSRCPANWVATNYALLNGSTSSANVNARYVELQSSLQPAC